MLEVFVTKLLNAFFLLVSPHMFMIPKHFFKQENTPIKLIVVMS